MTHFIGLHWKCILIKREKLKWKRFGILSVAQINFPRKMVWINKSGEWEMIWSVQLNFVQKNKHTVSLGVTVKIVIRGNSSYDVYFSLSPLPRGQVQAPSWVQWLNPEQWWDQSQLSLSGISPSDAESRQLCHQADLHPILSEEVHSLLCHSFNKWLLRTHYMQDLPLNTGDNAGILPAHVRSFWEDSGRQKINRSALRQRIGQCRVEIKKSGPQRVMAGEGCCLDWVIRESFSSREVLYQWREYIWGRRIPGGVKSSVMA